MATAYAHASHELIEQWGLDPQDIDAMQRACLLDQLDLRLLAVEQSAKYPEAYRLTIEGDGLPEGGEIGLIYCNDYTKGESRLVRWR